MLSENISPMREAEAQYDKRFVRELGMFPLPAHLPASSYEGLREDFTVNIPEPFADWYVDVHQPESGYDGEHCYLSIMTDNGEEAMIMSVTRREDLTLAETSALAFQTTIAMISVQAMDLGLI